ncbi:hypothetical protein C0Q70_04748 [Pomacea canaliculata]|uniref:SOCS box domain-containing protein n=1 Tax=Pomacea canaliculata TaxID=400727 RepID=A0A2T7PJD4_POMCA|nr:hypothetical protein C0Q70_04748 [Pomacea canaliculata]
MAHPNKALPLSKMATELNTAAESSNWTLVNDLLSVDGVCRCDVEQCSLLHKLAAAPEVSLSLAGDILTKILKHKVDINMVDTSGDTAVVVAARCDNTKMVMELLSRQAALPPDVTHVCSFLQTLTNNWKPQETPYMHALVVKLLWDRLQDTALHSCHKQLHHTLVRLAVTFHTSLVREMFVTEQQVNSVDSEGMAVLHRVAMFDSDDHVRLLHYFISKGANVNLQNTSGDTPLHIAAKNSNWMMMEALRNNNDINKKDGEGNTALHLAALAGNLSLMTTLLGRGARADGVNNEQKTVLLMMAMTKRELFSNINSYINVLVLTVKRGADIQQKNCDGNSALHLAAKHDSWIMVEFLLKYVDDAGQPDSEGFNILHRLAIATSLQDHSLFHKVAQKVGDINAKSKTGDTAIHLAAKCQNWDMVKLLEQEGAAWDELDSEGFHIVHRYAMGKNMEHNMLSFLDISMYCNTRCWTGDTVFHLAARHGNWSVVELIVDYVDNIDKVDSNGLTVIQRLVMSATNTFSSEYSLFCRLIELGADYTCRDQNGDTVLHLAARNGHWQIVKHLTNLGAEVDTKDSEGFSILHRIATEEKRSDSVTAKELSQCGAIIKQKDLQGNTPLHLAVQHKNWAVAKDLVKCGADVNDVDAEGFTVLHRLGQIHNYDHSSLSLIELLLEKGARSDIVSNGGETVWKIVVQNENWRMMECLLASRRLVFKEHEDKYLLHNLVCSHQGDNHVELCDLIQKRLPVNAKDRDGNSLLHLAAGAESGAHLNPPLRKGNSYFHEFARNTSACSNMTDITRLLLSRGFDINLRNDDGDTPVHVAADEGNWDTVKTFVDHGASTSIPDSKGYYLLHKLLNKQTQNIAIYIYHSKTSTYESLEQLLIRTLVTHGEDVNRRGPDNKTALQIAAGNDEWEIVGKLISLGAVYELNQNEKLSALKHLDSCHWEDVTREQLHLFIKYIANDGSAINNSFQEEYGYRNPKTVLQKCVEQANWKMAIALVECGADCTVGERSRSSSCRNFRTDTTQKSRGVWWTAHSECSKETSSCWSDNASTEAYRRHIASQRSFLEQPVSPTERAVQKRHISAVKLLIQSGASSNSELFRLNTEYQVKMAVLADTNNDVRELLEVLSKAASEPHSLQSLCRLSVSHWLGCGPGRADKLKSLKIPSSLKNLISFCDLLSTEFVFHKHEDLSSSFSEEDDDFHLYSDYNDSDRSIDYSVGEDSLPFHSNLDYYFE